MIKLYGGAAALLLLLTLSAVSLALAPVPDTVGPIYDGPELDYQPSIIRVEPGGELMVVFERLNVANQFGDFYVAFSADDGQSWSPPQPAIVSPLNERHPSLLQLGDGTFVLFYLVDETGGGAYRLYRATSPDGLAWTQDPARLDLGWSTPGEINPNVIRETDGTLTMTYHRLPYPGLSHIAQSHDGGATWDQLMTPVSDGDANLPRLAKREGDGLYLVTYQIGGSDLDLFAKVSADPYDWNVPQIPVSTAINTHDSQPIVLEDGAFLVTYAKTPIYYFDLFYRITYDGLTWRDEVQVTDDHLHYDTQPHPLLHGTPGRILLTWSHQDGPTPYVDHDVWINTDLLVQPNLHLGALRQLKLPGPVPGVYYLLVLVRVHDQDHAAAPDVTVYGEWRYPGGSILPRQAVTNAEGWGRLVTVAAQAGLYRFCVTDVVRDGYVYNPAANHTPVCRIVLIGP